MEFWGQKQDIQIWSQGWALQIDGQALRWGQGREIQISIFQNVHGQLILNIFNVNCREIRCCNTISVFIHSNKIMMLTHFNNIATRLF